MEEGNTLMDNNKVAVVGCGSVGSSTAFALMKTGLFSEIALLDTNRERAELEALDMTDGPSFETHVSVFAADYDEIMDSGIIVVTAGTKSTDGNEKEEVNANVEIIREIAAEIGKRNYQGIVVIAANPVDLLTLTMITYSGLPEHRVIGLGTVLDTARLKVVLGEQLNVDSKNIHAFIIGENGEDEMVAWSSAHVAGTPIREFCRQQKKESESIDEVTAVMRNRASAIINDTDATVTGTAMATAKICRSIVLNEKTVLPVSSLMNGEFGIDGISLSVPSVVGKDGVECHVPIFLDRRELEDLRKTADSIRNTAVNAGIL